MKKGPSPAQVQNPGGWTGQRAGGGLPRLRSAGCRHRLGLGRGAGSPASRPGLAPRAGPSAGTQSAPLLSLERTLGAHHASRPYNASLTTRTCALAAPDALCPVEQRAPRLAGRPPPDTGRSAANPAAGLGGLIPSLPQRPVCQPPARHLPCLRPLVRNERMEALSRAPLRVWCASYL